MEQKTPDHKRQDPEAPATFVFADLVGYTTLTAVMGDHEAADLATRFYQRVGELARTRGRGDQVDR